MRCPPTAASSRDQRDSGPSLLLSRHLQASRSISLPSSFLHLPWSPLHLVPSQPGCKRRRSQSNGIGRSVPCPEARPPGDHRCDYPANVHQSGSYLPAVPPVPVGAVSTIPVPPSSSGSSGGVHPGRLSCLSKRRPREMRDGQRTQERDRNSRVVEAPHCAVESPDCVDEGGGVEDASRRDLVSMRRWRGPNAKVPRT